jgi:fumarate reductase subunit D
MRIKPHRHHPLWFAYLAHRLSGLILVIFLPFHFYILSLALNDADKLDYFLSLAANPLVKIAEFGLVFLLALHFFGGIRLLAVEFLPWSSRQKTYAALAVSGSFFVALSFLLNAVT